MPHGIIGLLCRKMFESKWYNMASLGCYIQKWLKTNDAIQHLWVVMYITMEYMSVYAVC